VALVVGLVLVVGLAAAAAYGGWAAWTYYSRGYVYHAPSPGQEVTVTIPEGASLATIAQILQDDHVVLRARAFKSRAEADGYDKRFQPGTFQLRQYAPYREIVDRLLAGNASDTVKVTIPEGLTVRETADVVAAKVESFPYQDYLDLTLRHPVDVDVAGMTPGTKLEGVLFPARYEFPPVRTAQDLLDTQVGLFKQAMARVDMARAAKAHLTEYDVLIIASLIEREVQVPAERKLVAAVVWNRLRRDMPLQIDATIVYALGKRKPVLTLDDLKVDSPYNTYLHRGLPPTPICNPGLASLQAAAQPASVSYLYYVVRNDGTGRHYFSTDYDQFLRDKERAGL
jgi:UPF0755 protein